MNISVRYITVLLIIICYSKIATGQLLDLKFDHITSEDGLPQSTIHGIVKDKYGFMWFGTWSGLCRYDGYAFKTYYYSPHDPRSINNSRIHNLTRDQNGDIWVLTYDETEFCRYQYETDDFERVRKEQAPYTIRQQLSRKNHLYKVSDSFQSVRWRREAGTNAIIEIDTVSGKRRRYTRNPVNPWSMNDAYISDFYLDDQHILWLGSYSSGINKAYLQANPFAYLYHDPTTVHAIADNNIRSICEDLDGNLWIGTRNNGISVRQKDGTYRQFTHEEGNPHSIQSDYIKKIVCDRAGYIWIGTRSGVDRYNPRTKKMERLHIPDLEGTSVYGICEDHRNNIWLATWQGLAIFNRENNTFRVIDPTTTLASPRVWLVFQDSRRQIWAGTEGGGISILQMTDRGEVDLLKQLRHDSRANHTLSDDRIYTLCEDSKGYIWIGTGNGIDRYHLASGQLQRLSHLYPQLPRGSIAGLTEDNEGFIWVSHKRGLSKINPSNMQVRNFSKQDGLQGNEFSEGVVYKSKQSDRLYFGGNNGINSFLPAQIKTDTISPVTVLTELAIFNRTVHVGDTVDGRVVLEKPLYMSKSLLLMYHDRSFSIEFAALHFVNPKGNKYAYKLEGFDKDWIYTDAANRKATYANLAPGRYIFLVKASNSDGIWNDNPTRLEIKVDPPWWASNMAYVGYILAMLLLLLLTYYYLMHYAKLKSRLAYESLVREKEIELHENKVKFFTHISHEIKTPLTLILSPIQQISRLTVDNAQVQGQLLTMQKNGDRLLHIVTQLLDIRRLESGQETLQRERHDMLSMLKDIMQKFEPLALEKQILLTQRCTLSSLTFEFDVDKMEKVMSNILSNALKFTPRGGTVDVSVSREEDSAILTVADNGVGISQSNRDDIFKPFKLTREGNPTGSGLGLAYSKSLIELHGGEIEVISCQTPPHQGTTFRVLIPIVNAPDKTPAESTTLTTGDSVIAEHTAALLTENYPLTERPVMLIVEDNPEMRLYIHDYFAPSYHILLAEDGVEGLEIANNQLPDVIISDVMMPRMDGITLSQQIKSALATAHIPVILLTARTLPAYEREGLETGADDYILKPFDIELLSLKVRNQIGIRIRMQEKFKQKLSISATEVNIESPDDRLLQQTLQYIEDRIAETDLRIEDIAETVGMSRSNFFRKIKALSGYSPADMIREVRLKRAQQLLRDRKFNISEITYMVGFSDVDYFRKSFKTRFGQSPSAYAKQQR